MSFNPSHPNGCHAALDAASRATWQGGCGRRLSGPRLGGRGDGSGMDDRSPGLTYDRVKWLFDLPHLAQPSDVIPDQRSADPGSRATWQGGCGRRLTGPRLRGRGDGSGMDDRSLGFTCDSLKTLRNDTAAPDHRGCHPGPAQRRSGIQHCKSECQHLAPDVMPHLMRHPEQHGTEDAAYSLFAGIWNGPLCREVLLRRRIRFVSEAFVELMYKPFGCL